MQDERLELEKVTLPEQAPLARPGYPKAPGYPGGYGYGYGEESGAFSVRGVWRTVRKRLPMILVIVVIATTWTTLQVYREKNIYQASATIEIGKDRATVLRSGETIIQTDEYYDAFLASRAMESKIRQIRSYPLLEDVAARLKLDENPKFLDVTRRKSFAEALQAIGNRVWGAKGEKPEAGGDAEAQPQTALPQLPEGGERFEPYVGVLNANLSAEPIEETPLLVLSFTHTDPELAAAVANTVAQAFIDRDFEKKTEKFTKASEWLERSTNELKARVQKAEQALADYTREKGIFSTDGKETLTAEKLKRLHDQATRAETDRMLLESLYAQVKQGRVAQVPEAFADPKTAALRAKLGELAVEAAELDVKFGPKNPRVIAVRQQMAALEEQINANRATLEAKIQADYERAVRDEQSLKAALERAKSEAVKQNQDAIQYSILMQEVETAKSLYKDFLNKHSQAEIQRAEQHSNIKVVEPARTPKGPIGPRRFRSIMIALFLSLTAGIGLAFALEYFDNTIKSVEDVGRYAQLPALGVIPAVAGRRSPLSLKKGGRKAITAGGRREGVASAAPLVTSDNRSAVAEAYRELRTSVMLSAAGNPPKTILITSSQPGEGKTTTTINTAISLAQLGAKVLVIDCDLRKPTAHKVLGVDHASGLSTYLSRDVSLDEVIQEPQVANVSIIPCGPIPPNPAELISSERMKEMLRLLSERFDHILIDSPPLINVT
ncbi:MAG TPA: polysaccharide biosynthesis tyrosine autokinase, partial [Blastocatellia bacterium]|nr:polysaccharide biosynthesis tyrosine autokinase [Blastocatellia bacterium]